MWHSGDEDRLQSQRSEEKKILGLGIGLGLVVSVLFFLKNTPPPCQKKSGKITLLGKGS